MNETTVIALFILVTIAFIALCVGWFLRAYKDEDIDSNDYLFDDFYMLAKGNRDEDSW